MALHAREFVRGEGLSAAGRFVTLGFAAPEIEIVLMNPTGVPATAAGETAITLVAAAVGNAIFDATGIRLRTAPFTAERVKAAFQAA